ncbi:MAG: hypothetical protein HQL21_03945 [Candidatus Omnitrophica bacterium]|nr:hypothetical protein [Candidatus Omnitrophota bacterium]
MLGRERNSIGQSVVEYLLLLSVVGILAFLAMKPEGIVNQVQDKATLYYKEGAKKVKNIP